MLKSSNKKEDPTPIKTIRQPVKCPHCRTVLFDGIVLKSRVVRLLPKGGEAKCRCKRWVQVPVTYLT